MLIDAYARASRKQPIALAIYGDGPFRARVERRSRNVPGVLIEGVVDQKQLATALASGDALLHGSTAETYGLAVGEALCAGLPLIIPDRGGAGAFADPSCAEVYPAGSIKGCAAAILRMAQRNRAELRARCLEVAAKQVWSVERHFATLFDHYETLASRRRSERSVS